MVLNPWRRFLRWLAAHEIGLARAEEASAARLALDFHKQMAYAEGMRAGAEAAFRGMERAINERTGAIDVEPGDLERARKGWTH